MIWAEDSKHGIGKSQTIPWKIPDDMLFFKKTTTGNTVVMGRKTFNSIGKPLPNRDNIVLTHHTDTLPNRIVGVSSFEELEKITDNHSENKYYVIGGAFLYNHLLKYADELLVTRVDGDYNCDVFAPAIPEKNFKLVSEKLVDKTEAAPKHSFQVWRRIID